MKYFSTLIIGALSVLSASSATIEKLRLSTDQWGSSLVANSNVTLLSTSQYGEFNISNTLPVDMNTYTGVRVDYSNAITAEDGSFYQIVLGGGTYDSGSYSWSESDFVDLDATKNTITVTFDKTKFVDSSIQRLALQAKGVGCSIMINSAYLIKGDGSEVQIVFGGVSWGLTRTDNYPDLATFNFTNSYGGQKVQTMDNAECTYKTPGQAYVYTMELTEPTSDDGYFFEADGESGGYAWFNLPAGVSTFTFAINDSTNKQELKTLWFKHGGNSAVTPATITIKSLTRTPVASYYVLGDFSAWTLAGTIAGAMTTTDGVKYIRNITTTKVDQYWKIAPQSSLLATDLDWTKMYGVATDGSTASSGTLIQGDNVGALKIATAGSYVLQLNAETLTYTLYTAEEYTAGVNGVLISKPVANGEIFNLAGQRVSESYKGVVIKNGKKHINR